MIVNPGKFKTTLAMISNDNINRGIQLIIDVIDYRMLKGKYLVSTLFAHLVRLHNHSAIIDSSVQ